MMRLEGTYELRLGEKCVGSVHVRREGLYYALRCCCPRLSRGMFELHAAQENMGLLVPTGEGMGLQCRIAAKRLGAGETAFFLRERNADAVTLDAGKPFAYLQRLNEAYLVKEGEKTMIAFRKWKAEE